MELLWDVVEWEMQIIDVLSTNLQQLCGDMVNESVESVPKTLSQV